MVAANTAPASAQLAALNKQLVGTTAQANTTSAAVGGGMSKGGKMAAVGLGAAAVAAIGVGKALSSSVRAASSFESTFAEVRKTVDTNEAGFKRIERGLRNLAKEIPVPVEELNNLAGEAGALGIASKDIVTFTRVASQLGTTTNMSSSDAANALARLANIMGTSSSKFENMASALVGLGNAGASTESEIADMALRIASTGKQVGLTEAQVLGFASALSSVGIEAEAGGSAISRAFSLISRSVATGNEDLAGFAKVAQMSVPQFSKLFEKNAAKGMLAFIKGLGEIKKNGGNALVELEKLGINEVRLTNALLSAAGAGDLFNDQLKLSSEEFRRNGALAEEAQKRYETFQQQVELLKNNFNDLLITVGNKVLPVLKELVKEVNSVLSDDALSGQEKFAKIFGALTDVAVKAFGNMLEAAVKVSPQIAGALVKGIIESNAWVKLAAGALLLRAMGGRAAIAKIGAFIGIQTGTSMAAGIAAGMSGGAAAGAAGGAAAGGLFGRVSGALKSIKWGRVGMVGVGLLLGDQLMQSIGNRVQQGSADLSEALDAMANKPFLEDKVGKIFDGISMAITGNIDMTEAHAEYLQRFFDQYKEGQGFVLPAQEKELQNRVAALDLTREQTAEIQKMFQLLRVGRELGIAVGPGMDPEQLRRIASGFEVLRSGALSNLSDIERVTNRTGDTITRNFGPKTAEGRRLLADNMRAAADAIRSGINQGAINAEKGTARIKKLLANAKLIDPTRKQAHQLGRLWAQGFREMGQITNQGVTNVLNQAKRMPPTMRKIAVNTLMAQLDAAKKAKDITPKEYQRLKSRVLSEFQGLAVGVRKSAADLPKSTKNPSDRTKKQFDSVASSAEKSSQRIKTAIKSIPGPVRGAYGRLAGYANSAAEAFGSNDRVRLSFRRGGMAKFSGPGLVPAMVSPGELISYKGREVYVPGRPEPRDSVMMQLPPGAKVFTFDGQARMAMGASQNEALRKQAPHFATGGMVGKAPRPRLTGGARVPRATGQSAIDRAREQAEDWVKRLKPTLDMITRIASSFGLQMSSGYRAGDDGYHGVNRARDYSNAGGPTPEMFKFGTYVADNYQKHLLELIYSPLGFGIKNGARTAPYAVADHYDHVHVAMRRGGRIPRFKKGGFVGNINKIWGEHNSGFGDWGGPTLPSYVVAALAQAAGMPGKTMEQVTRGESGAHAKHTARPGATGIDPGGTKGHGLWMITSGFNEDLAAKVGGWRQMLNPVINAWAANEIYQRQGLRAWYGTGSVTGDGIRYSGKYDIANALGGLSYRGALWMATGGKLGKKPKAIAEMKKRANQALRRIKSARGIGRTGFLDAASKNANKAHSLADQGEITKARERMAKANSQIRKAMRGRKPGSGSGNPIPEGTPNGTTIKEARRMVAFIEEEIELLDTQFDAEWSLAGTELDPSERSQLIEKNTQLLEWLRVLRSKVKSAIKFWEDRVPKLRKMIETSRDKIKDLKDKIKGSKDKEQIKKWQKQIKGHEKDIGQWSKGVNNGTSGLSDLRSELEDLQGVTRRGGKIAAVKFVLDGLNYVPPPDGETPGDSAADSEIADLLRQQLQETQRSLAISQAQMPIFQQFMPRFHQGGIVQGPMGAERPVMAQAGEGIFTRDQMRAMGSQNITVVIEDAAIDSNRIRVEVDGVIQDKVSTVRRQGSNRRFATSR